MQLEMQQAPRARILAFFYRIMGNPVKIHNAAYIYIVLCLLHRL